MDAASRSSDEALVLAPRVLHRRRRLPKPTGDCGCCCFGGRVVGVSWVGTGIAG